MIKNIAFTDLKIVIFYKVKFFKFLVRIRDPDSPKNFCQEHLFKGSDHIYKRIGGLKVNHLRELGMRTVKTSEMKVSHLCAQRTDSISGIKASHLICALLE